MLQPRAAGCRGCTLFRETVENIDELRETLGALSLSLLDSVRDAFLDVKFHDGQADAIQRRLGGGELLQDLYAQPRLLDHAPDAPHLTFNAVQARDEGLLL